MNNYTKDQILNLLRVLRREKEITMRESEQVEDALEKDDDWMTTKEVAEMLKISPHTVSNYSGKGIFKKHKIGGTCRYQKSEILESMGLE